jgi:hypothetical protein
MDNFELLYHFKYLYNDNSLKNKNMVKTDTIHIFKIDIIKSIHSNTKLKLLNLNVVYLRL